MLITSSVILWSWRRWANILQVNCFYYWTEIPMGEQNTDSCWDVDERRETTAGYLRGHSCWPFRQVRISFRQVRISFRQVRILFRQVRIAFRQVRLIHTSENRIQTGENLIQAGENLVQADENLVQTGENRISEGCEYPSDRWECLLDM